jgi:transcriptional regulator with XRE-family HTH domain
VKSRGARRTPPKEIEREMKSVGARVRALREKRGLSQQELADLVGVHLSQLSRLERGTSLPSAETVLALARALRATTDALLRGDRDGEELIEFGNIRLYEKFRLLDKLPKEEQEIALQILDGVIAKYELGHLADRMKKSA